jgi:hypothetical protein
MLGSIAAGFGGGSRGDGDMLFQDENGRNGKRASGGSQATNIAERRAMSFSEKYFWKPLPVHSLAFFRIALTLCMLGELVEGWRRNWLQRNYIYSPFHFSYYGFEWVQPAPPSVMPWVFAAYGVLILLVLAGVFYRWAMILLTIFSIYLFLAEAIIYLNHWYLTCLLCFLLALVPANAVWSVDSLRVAASNPFAPAWMLNSLRAMMAIVYFYAGLAKLNPDWLAGRPLTQWISDRSTVPIIGPLLAIDGVGQAMAIAGALLDLFLIPMLLYAPTRFIGMVLIGCFHTVNALLWPIGAFPLLSMAGVLLYLPAQSFCFGRYTPAEPWPAKRSQVGFFLVCIFLIWQCLFPLRHYLLPGNTSWTEEGHQFSWRMMLRDKPADVTFVVFEDNWASSKPPKLLSAYDLMYADRARTLASHPRYIVQFAQEIKRRYAEKHIHVSVHVLSVAALNGRPLQLLVRPDLDLGRTQLSWRPFEGIAPLGTPMPERITVRGKSFQIPTNIISPNEASR